MSNETTKPATTPDMEGQQAFEKFDRLLRRVQKGSPSRATGAALIAAKAEYNAFLPVLQPIGQGMLTRAIATLGAIEGRLKLPPSHKLSGNDFKNRRFGTFEAGQFQLNEDASLYVRAKAQAEATLDVEIRLFTRKVRAFVPTIAVIDGKRRQVDLFDGSSFVTADSYEELADKIVSRVQAQLDALPPSPSRVPTCDTGSREAMYEWFEKMADQGLDFHPDDVGEDIVNAGTMQRVFTDEEATQVREIVRGLFAQHGGMVYDAALAATGVSDDPDDGEDDECSLRP
ncbi:hypothetical protein LJR168_003768 [Pseudoxanthomonas sp. LjRoot168]|uniref:hypothetical protein n=1 Tax=unclassified Pseudoxanthomonas TaxID=2645906 RepID=UPI003ED03B6C